MNRWQNHLRLGVVVLALPLALTACGGKSSSSASEPATVEQVAGTDAYRVTLSVEAAKRLRVQTSVATNEGNHTVIPYSAVLYAPTGTTWAYVSTKPLTFERQPIIVDYIAGDRAVLSNGPAPGTRVATVGVVELFGVESGIDG